MTLIDAIKTGRHFRIKGTEDWIAVSDWNGKFCLTKDGSPVELNAADVLATNYEVQEPKVEITRSQLAQALGSIPENRAIKITNQDSKVDAIFVNRDHLLQELARNLGLEEL